MDPEAYLLVLLGPDRFLWFFDSSLEILTFDALVDPEAHTFYLIIVLSKSIIFFHARINPFYYS